MAFALLYLTFKKGLCQLVIKTKRLVINIAGRNQLGNITNMFDQNDGKTNHNGPVASRCREHGRKNNQSNCHL